MQPHSKAAGPDRKGCDVWCVGLAVAGFFIMAPMGGLAALESNPER